MVRRGLWLLAFRLANNELSSQILGRGSSDRKFTEQALSGRLSRDEFRGKVQRDLAIKARSEVHAPRMSYDERCRKILGRGSSDLELTEQLLAGRLPRDELSSQIEGYLTITARSEVLTPRLTDDEFSRKILGRGSSDRELSE